MFLVHINSAGEAVSVQVLRSPSPEVTMAVARTLLSDTKFKGAVCAGAPCAMDFPFAMTLK